MDLKKTAVKSTLIYLCVKREGPDVMEFILIFIGYYNSKNIINSMLQNSEGG